MIDLHLAGHLPAASCARRASANITAKRLGGHHE